LDENIVVKVELPMLSPAEESSAADEPEVKPFFGDGKVRPATTKRWVLNASKVRLCWVFLQKSNLYFSFLVPFFILLIFKLFYRLDNNLVVKVELPLHTPAAESSAAHEPLVKTFGEEEKVEDGVGMGPKRWVSMHCFD
jgi:hypothetical protein